MPAIIDSQQWIVKTKVPKEVYTDREELLDRFYKTAFETSRRRSMSSVLLGYRRMGKTEIFRRVVNRLFFEQTPKNPGAVVPIYFSFPDKKTDEMIFAREYLENFIQFYFAFYLDDPEVARLKQSKTKLKQIAARVENAAPSKKMIQWLMETLDAIETFPIPVKVAVEAPRTVSDNTDASIAVFLDEFQNTRLPQYDFDIAGIMQEAVDSVTCPHFVTGSAMSMLSMEVAGGGSLFGRFDFERIEAMTGYHGTDLALKAADYYGAVIDELTASAVSKRCGGNPFYITAVVRQAAKSGRPVSDADALDEILAVDITSGFIWGELCDQVNRWIERINEFNITKWILYLTSMEEADDPGSHEIDVARIQGELKTLEGIDVEPAKIRDVMIMLSRGDLLEYRAGSFYRLKDPILCDFLKVWGKIELEAMPRSHVQNDLRNKYHRISKRSLSEYKGWLGEIHMSQVLLAGQRKMLPGDLFHADSDIQPPEFSFVRHRVRLSSGKGMEIDLLGAAGHETWVCQSKWVKRKTGIRVLKELEAQADAVMKDMEPLILKKWVFAYAGLTKDAEKFATANGIYWSSGKEMNALLEHLNLRALCTFI